MKLGKWFTIDRINHIRSDRYQNVAPSVHVI
jgi:hypothetical protein